MVPAMRLDVELAVVELATVIQVGPDGWTGRSW
jgi:hypothetical protein